MTVRIRLGNRQKAARQLISDAINNVFPLARLAVLATDGLEVKCVA
jgi:hypothetical protein